MISSEGLGTFGVEPESEFRYLGSAFQVVYSLQSTGVRSSDLYLTL